MRPVTNRGLASAWKTSINSSPKPPPQPCPRSKRSESARGVPVLCPGQAKRPRFSGHRNAESEYPDRPEPLDRSILLCRIFLFLLGARFLLRLFPNAFAPFHT